jgi:hypothetical protein
LLSSILGADKLIVGVGNKAPIFALMKLNQSKGFPRADFVSIGDEAILTLGLGTDIFSVDCC